GNWSTPWDQTTVNYAELPLPASVFQVIDRRLKRLNPTERTTLNVAAVLGDDFDFALLTQAGELEREDTLAAMDELLRRRLLVEEPSVYRFSHDKVRQATYQSIQETERRRLHRRAGRALENLHPEQVEQLAHHFDLGQVWDKAVEYNHRAGERARAVYAGAEAIGYYDRACRAWRRLGPPDEELGFNLYQERGGICQDTGRFDQAEADFRAAYDLAERAGDRMGQAHVLNHLSYLQFQRGDFDKAAAIAQQVLELSEAAGLQSETATGLFNKANAIRNLGHYQQAIASYEQAAAIYETSDEQARLADSLNRMGAALYHTGDYARGQRAMERSLAIRRQLDDKMGVSYSLVNLSSLYYHQGQFGSARKAAQEALETASSIGDPYGEDAALSNLGMAILEQGDPAQAVILIRRSLEIGREIGDQALEPDALSELGKAYHVLGDLEQARKMLEKALETASISIARFQLPLIHVRLAQLFLARGQDDEALTQARAGLREAEGVDDPWQRGVAHRMMAQVAAQIGSQEAETEPATHFEESVRILRNISAEAELARSLAAYSLYLRRWGDADRARRGATMMEEARALFQRLGMDRDLHLLEERAAACPPPGRMRVRLPAASAPTGRPLRDDEYVTVTWTVAVPEDKVIPGKVTRRRHRLLRLLRQAAEQSAAPTAPDLAEALDVSARTIERDLAALRDAGHDARTRGSRSLPES
ncbi:MAG: tetratricopeptide repeat protein, partial [Chloroflexota bacterium]|nr:tetratricopeptide repeat protein [Chloroflexota bacterium]